MPERFTQTQPTQHKTHSEIIFDNATLFQGFNPEESPISMDLFTNPQFDNEPITTTHIINIVKSLPPEQQLTDEDRRLLDFVHNISTEHTQKEQLSLPEQLNTITDYLTYVNQVRLQTTMSAIIMSVAEGATPQLGQFIAENMRFVFNMLPTDNIFKYMIGKSFTNVYTLLLDNHRDMVDDKTIYFHPAPVKPILYINPQLFDPETFDTHVKVKSKSQLAGLLNTIIQLEEISYLEEVKEMYDVRNELRRTKGKSVSAKKRAEKMRPQIEDGGVITLEDAIDQLTTIPILSDTIHRGEKFLSDWLKLCLIKYDQTIHPDHKDGSSQNLEAEIRKNVVDYFINIHQRYLGTEQDVKSTFDYVFHWCGLAELFDRLGIPDRQGFMNGLMGELEAYFELRKKYPVTPALNADEHTVISSGGDLDRLGADLTVYAVSNGSQTLVEAVQVKNDSKASEIQSTELVNLPVEMEKAVQQNGRQLTPDELRNMMGFLMSEKSLSPCQILVRQMCKKHISDRGYSLKRFQNEIDTMIKLVFITRQQGSKAGWIVTNANWVGEKI